ncbi:Centrosomal protein of 95 kDa [Aphanomyces cochlioides]|nr:Centrosomal protein of 95 kDa [Aphanomyces cochlioides]
MTSPRSDRLVEETNALLKLSGFGDRAFKDVNELVSSVSSMSVALYERFFDVRLDDIIREPHSIEDYSHNAQLVVDNLAAALLTEDLQHVTGAKVCTGDLDCIRALIRVLSRVYHMLHRSRLDSSYSSSSNADLPLDQTFYAKRTAKKTKKQRPASAKNSQGTDDPSLLTTQKYGRFVSTSSSHRSQSKNSKSSSVRKSAKSSAKAKPSRTLDFGSLSSVSMAASRGEVNLTGLEFSESSNEIRLAAPTPPSPPKHNDGSLHMDDLAPHTENSPPAHADVTPPSPKATITHAEPAPTSPLKREELKIRLQPTSADRLHQLRYKTVLNEHVQNIRLQEMKTHRRMERAFHHKQHTERVERIRSMRLHDELKLQRLALGVQQKRLEEKNLKETMQHLLMLEKARLKQEHEQTAEVLKAIQREHAQRESALEQFFVNQMQMVKEERDNEVRERALLQQAHKQASDQMLRELRSSREKEVAALMEQREHLAQVQQVRQERHMARYIAQTYQNPPTDAFRKKIDPFYAAAMKSRATRQQKVAQVQRIYGTKQR